MLYTNKLTAQVFIVFLERLMQERTRTLDLDCGQTSGASLPSVQTVAKGSIVK